MKCEECGFPLTIDDIEVYRPEQKRWWRIKVIVSCPNCGHEQEVPQ